MDLGDGPSPLLDLLRGLLSDPSDELTILSLPLLDDEASGSEIADDELPDSLSTKRSGGRMSFRSPIVREIRSGFDMLAAFERTRGSKLHSLRRIVTFSSLSMFLHIINRSLDYEDGRAFNKKRPPMLLDFVQRGWLPIAAASAATYNLARKSIERLLRHGMGAALEEEHGPRWTKRKAEDFIGQIGLRSTRNKETRTRKYFLEVFRSYSGGGHSIPEALMLAAVDALVADLTGTPSDYARALGVRAGLLAPRGQRAVRKRYAPGPEVLEVLLASTVASDEEIELEELTNRWWERYGILTGARKTDSRDLTQRSILDASKEELAANADALRRTLIDIGYARRYADGVTIIRLGTGG
jgi:hypothetical protein